MMDSTSNCVPLIFSSMNLKSFTEGLSDVNLIGRTQFGIIYRGKIHQGPNEVVEVTVKIWESHEDYKHLGLEDRKLRFHDEMKFMQDPCVKNKHPNLAKLIGYCPEDELLGAVYELKSVDTLNSLIEKDSLTWLLRIKVAVGLAHLLEFLHSQKLPYWVRNLSADHIMVDQEFNPILLDFGLLTGGIIGKKRDRRYPLMLGSIGYMDPHLCLLGIWSERCDIYAYGVILLSLIAKKAVDKNNTVNTTNTEEWAKLYFKPAEKSALSWWKKPSVAHKSLRTEMVYDKRDGLVITELALQCVEFHAHKRPPMFQIVQHLEKLNAVQRHGKIVGINPVHDHA